MEGKGIVKSVDGDKIVILSYKKASCDKCVSCSSGGKFQRESEFVIEDMKEIKEGDTVRFTVKDKKVMQYSMLIYIFPILGFFLGFYLVGVFLPESSELPRIIGSFAGMGACFFIVSLLDRVLGKGIVDEIEVIKRK